MCPKMEWFNTYKSYERDSVLIGNDVVCKTADINNIRVRMFEGQVQTLRNVRHIPDLKKNLLSLGPLKAQGYKFSCANGGIKVTKGSMMILKTE